MSQSLIDSIPNELLSAIFHSARPHAFHLARSITLSHVCTRWRAVVLGDAQMWNSISLDDSDHRKFAQQGEGELCLRTFLDVVPIILARSRDAPLYLDLRNVSESSDSTTLTRLVPLLLPNVHRIVDLCLEICDPSNLMTILRGGLSFPELRKLSLNVIHGFANINGERPARLDMDVPVASVVALFGIIPSDIKTFFSPSLKLVTVWIEVTTSSLATDLSNALLSCPILTNIGISALIGVPLVQAEHVPAHVSTTGSWRQKELRELHLGFDDIGARTNYLRTFSGATIQHLSISRGNLRTFIDPAFLAMACRNLSHVTSAETSLQWIRYGIRLRLSTEQGPILTIEEQLRLGWYDHAADFAQLFGLLESVSNKIYSSLRAVTFSLLTWDLWAALLADKPPFVTGVDKVVVTVPPEASTGDFKCDYCALWFPGISTITVDVDYVHQPPIPLDTIRQILDGVQYGDEDDCRKPVAKLPSEHIEGLQCSVEWATEFAGARYTRWKVVPMKLLLHPYM